MVRRSDQSAMHVLSKPRCGKVPSVTTVASLWLTLAVFLVITPPTHQTYEYNDFKVNAAIKEQCGCMMGPGGAPGVPGVPGLHGSRGQDGRKGEKGSKGQHGDFGVPGPIGQPGLMGPDGRRGRKGDPGVEGPRGSTGEKGIKGERGYSGMVGPVGPSGESARPPRRMAFSVARSQRLGPVLQDTPVTFDVLFTNVGEAFDVYSSQFVCRTNGTYVFMTHILGQNNKDCYAWIMLNDKHKVPLHGDGRAGYGTGSQTIIMQLHVDDHVWIQLSKDSGLLNDYTTFSGYLLFDD